MDDNPFSLTGAATEVLGLLTLGSMIVLGVVWADWVSWDVIRGVIRHTDGASLAFSSTLIALVVGYLVQGLGFLFLEPLLRIKDPQKYMLVGNYDDNLATKLRRLLTGLPKEYNPSFRMSLRRAIVRRFGQSLGVTLNGIKEKSLSENAGQAFRLCWRTAAKEYPAASSASSSAFALRNFYMRALTGAFFLVMIALYSVPMRHMSPLLALIPLATCLVSLRQSLYFNGEWVRNVYDCFYLWEKPR